MKVIVGTGISWPFQTRFLRIVKKLKEFRRKRQLVLNDFNAFKVSCLRVFVCSSSRTLAESRNHKSHVHTASLVTYRKVINLFGVSYSLSCSVTVKLSVGRLIG